MTNGTISSLVEDIQDAIVRVEHAEHVLASHLEGWFAKLMPPPHERLPLTLQGFVLHILPAYLVYYAMAVLVVQPGTRIYRICLLPVCLALAYHGAIKYDMSAGVDVMNHWNYGQGVAMFVLAMRVTEWAFLKKPLRRISRSEEEDEKPQSVWADAGDLLWNMRGIGWDFSRGMQYPTETRPTHSRLAFTISTLLHALRDLLICDVLHHLIQLHGPQTFGATNGGSILDPSLPPLERYTRSTILTIMSGLVIYFCLTMEYYLSTFLVFLFAGPLQDPRAWPPISEGPWRATSLADFWARRWHQSFRRPFIQVGGYPLRLLFGKLGTVVGVFVISGVLHDWGIWGMGRGTDFSRLGGFFLLNGVGVVLELIWERLSGRKVGGWAGWAWAMVWTISTGHLLIEGWLRRGLAGCMLLPPSLRLGKFLVDATGLGVHVQALGASAIAAPTNMSL